MAINEWSTVAANNASGVTGVNWAEGQAPSTVNDSARAVMADVAAWYGQAKIPEYLTGVSGTNTVVGTGPASMAAYATGQRFTFIPASNNTGATTLNITPSGGAALGAKNVFWNGAACVGLELKANAPATVLYDGTQFNILAGAANTLTVLRGYLGGLALSTAGGSGTMTIAVGTAADVGNAALMTLASSIGKTTSAWAVGTGNGGIDTGAIANSTWYHFYLIMRPDTGVVDVLFSTSASAPTMPANYTLKRRIGSGFTNGSAQWTLFVQDGDLFKWDMGVGNVNTTNPGTSAVLATTTTPLGVNTIALISCLFLNITSSTSIVLFTDPGQTDTAPDGTANFSFVTGTAAATAASGGELQVRTNTSSQIRYRVSASGAADVIRIMTKGWIDRRGRDA